MKGTFLRQRDSDHSKSWKPQNLPTDTLRGRVLTQHPAKAPERTRVSGPSHEAEEPPEGPGDASVHVHDTERG